eukprot:gene29337-22294_t
MHDIGTVTDRFEMIFHKPEKKVTINREAGHAAVAGVTPHVEVAVDGEEECRNALANVADEYEMKFATGVTARQALHDIARKRPHVHEEEDDFVAHAADEALHGGMS